MGLNVGEDGRDEISLLSFSDLSLVSDPGVEDGLDVGGDGGLLSKSVRLVLESGGFLGARWWSELPCAATERDEEGWTDLGEFEEGLGEGFDVLELSDGFNSRLDGFGVGGSGGVEDLGDFLSTGRSSSVSRAA